MRLSMKTRGLFLPWLAISVMWICVVGYQTWRDIPRDDWLFDSTNQLSDAINLLLYNPVARAIVIDSIVLALAPPILVLISCWVLVWLVRGFSGRQRPGTRWVRAVICQILRGGRCHGKRSLSNFWVLPSRRRQKSLTDM